MAGIKAKKILVVHNKPFILSLINKEMQDLRNQVFEIVKREGPILPIVIARKVGRDTIFASAVLSELISRKEVMFTKGKIGGSPLYYAQGQEPRLQALYSHLGEKPQKAFSLLKEKRVLQDTKCEPWQRVALREIQDFAKPMEVESQNGKEIFWRWYLVTEVEAQKLINGQRVQVIEKEVIPDVKPEIKIEEVKQQEVVKIEQKVQLEIKQAEKKEEKRELKEIDDTGLYKEVENYFMKSKIEVLEKEIIRKNSEIDYVISVPSEIGKLTYFVKVKSKQKVNEGDLSLARDKGRDKKLPVLFLSKGDMTKKAKEYLEKNLKGYLVFRKLS